MQHNEARRPLAPPRIVVMGVSGSGKSTFGALLADALGLNFADADDFHPHTNVAKMAAGVPLAEEDREPWLESLATWISKRPGGWVLACSALRASHRERLRVVPDVKFVHLTAPRAVLAERVRARTGHFMPPGLLDSQLAALEPLGPDEAGCTLSAQDPPAALLDACLDKLASRVDRCA